MADPAFVAKHDGKAFHTINNLVGVQEGYVVDEAYDLRLFEHREISTTGLLTILELAPRAVNPRLPSFIGRWDESGNRLDIDMADVSRTTARKFRKSQGGYSGHHPEPLLPDRRFRIDLRIPRKQVFQGVVWFGLGRKLAL